MLANIGIAKEPLVVLLFVALTIVLELVFKIVLKLLKKLSSKTPTDLDDQILEEVYKKTKYFSIIVAAYLAIVIAYGNIEIFGKQAYDWFILLLFIAASSVIIKIVDVSIEFYLKNIASKTETTLDDEILPMAKQIIIAALYVVMFVVVLAQLGIEISPIIAGLGIGGLAIGLALQDTLANFFAGVHIIADRPLKVGDYIKLEGKNIEGFVQEVNWRTTRIYALGNKVVVIPNKELANSIITNYNLPDETTGHVVRFGVAYGTDIEKVYDIAKDVFGKMHAEGLIILNQKAKPWIRIDGFGESSIDFVAGFTVEHYTKRFNAHRRFYELMYKELSKENIEIPFPTRTVFLREEKSREKKVTKKRRKR